MNRLWTSHLATKEERERFSSYIRNSKGVLDRLLELVEQEETSLNGLETSVTDYSNPSWSHLQADRNGYRRALRKLKQYLILDQKEENGQSPRQ